MTDDLAGTEALVGGGTRSRSPTFQRFDASSVSSGRSAVSGEPDKDNILSVWNVPHISVQHLTLLIFSCEALL